MTARPAVGLTLRSPRALRPCLRALEQAGARAVVFDLGLPRAELCRLYESVDGVLLPGGAGLQWAWRYHGHAGRPGRDGRAEGDPAGEARGESRSESHPGPADRPERAGRPERESADLQLARWALAEGRPLLGLCRGLQMMVLAAGGLLEPDVPGHRLAGVFPAHQLRVAPGSRLREALAAERTPVNSRHGRAARSLPPGAGLAVVAWSAADGVVEGVEGTGPALALGVQFHPENLVDLHEPSRRLFASFVAACRGGGG